MEDVAHYRMPTRTLAMAATALSVAALVVALISIDMHSHARSPNSATIESPGTIAVPTLVGLKVEWAMASAQQVGLSVQTVQAPSRVAPGGTVVAQQPVAGASIKKGDLVTLTVVSGP